MKSILFFALLLFGITFIFSAFQEQDNPWIVPENYVNMENPYQDDKASLDVGKSLYTTHCKSCHGKEGYGDGSKAAQLETSCGDFTTEEFHEQSDGALFYKTIEGRDDMPGFRKKMQDDEDIWSIVNYMRTMKE